MNAKLKLTVLVVLTAVCGACVVTWETPQNLFLFATWSAVLWIRVKRQRQSGGKNVMSVGLTHALVMAMMISAAVLAPVKRIDAVLQKPVQLGATRMTVAELSEYCEWNRSSLPLPILIPSGGAAASRELRFSSTEVSLQQFIREVEQQTGARHEFGGCGNAYSILYGSAYNFGLSFSPSSGSELRWE